MLKGTIPKVPYIFNLLITVQRTRAEENESKESSDPAQTGFNSDHVSWGIELGVVSVVYCN